MLLHLPSIYLANLLLIVTKIRQNLNQFTKVGVALLSLGLFVLPVKGFPSEFETPAFLKGSIYERVGEAKGVKPSLLYSLALVESGRAVGDNRNQVAPWPYVLRALDARYYAESQKDYEIAYELFEAKYGDKFDVGPLQVNIYWQVTKAKRLASGKGLLELETNLRIGAQVLREAMASTDDKELGVGRYHTWSDEARSRLFGKRVLSVHQNVINGS